MRCDDAQVCSLAQMFTGHLPYAQYWVTCWGQGSTQAEVGTLWELQAGVWILPLPRSRWGVVWVESAYTVLAGPVLTSPLCHLLSLTSWSFSLGVILLLVPPRAFSILTQLARHSPLTAMHTDV